MNLEERLYTSTEVANILGVSLRSVYRYLDQGKLEAEIKTATGRLRFTKQNIVDFLYPDGEEESIGGTKSAKSSQNAKQSEPAQEEQEKSAAEQPEPEDTDEPEEEEESEEDEDVAEEREEEEEVDWLSKFKKAAAQFETTEPKPTSEAASKPEKSRSQAQPTPQPASQPSPQPEPEAEAEKESVSALATDEESNEVVYKYYKSMLGGLKEVAQNIDKVSRKSGVDYAFTLYAGLSLDKPLKKPFSILHTYVDAESEELYKRMLQLEETDENNAQLCLMFAKGPKVFANRDEKHGLFVVSEEQMVEDFKTLGKEEELKEIL